GAVSPLVTTDWVASQLGTIKNPNQAKIRLIEISARGYKTGHIPGAVHIKWQSEVFDPETDHLVPGVGEIQRIINKLGIDKNTHVVIYDGDGKIHHATRLYWTLKYWHIKNISIMDGSKPQWVLEKRQLTKQVPNVKRQKFTVRYPPATRIRAMFSPHIISALANDNVMLVDGRQAAYYNGDLTRITAYVRSGHIPGAINIPTMDAMKGDKFKSIGELKKLYVGKGVTAKKKAILYCDTGVLSSHAWFVVSELLGYKKVKVYDASMREYANRFDTPLEPGEVEGMFPTTPIQDLQDMLDK
ncbi:MAG: sulfurtransferase, partial [Proteobacteria bacterium]|nr:sulfurtransferase [Pseudomonadota bacterium]